MQYRFQNKAQTLSFGVVPDVSLREARDKQADARKLLRNGIDPSQVRRELISRARTQPSDSFEAIAREWHTQLKGRWTARYSESVLRSLEKEVFPHIGKLPIQDINPPMVLTVVRRIEQRDALSVAARTLQWVGAVYRYAIRTSRADRNPASDLVGSIRTRKTTHRPALSRAELPEFLRRVETYPGFATTHLALKLLVLSLVKSGELRGARWV
jgi:integrase